MFGAICQTFAVEVALMMVLKDEPSEIWEKLIDSRFYLLELADIL